MRKKKLLVTGGAGFIGSEFVRKAVRKQYQVVVVDSLSYAADKARLETVRGKIKFYESNILERKKIEKIFQKERPEAVVHFAAESHVDRSIHSSGVFIKTNVLGTQTILDVSRSSKVKRFVHISTDEVYGDILKGKFHESFPLNPSSPYSSSKAAADLLVRSYIRTFGFPAIIVRPSNNYGPWQYPEKFIPVVIYKALKNEPIPVYDKGLNVREWLYVSDCADAVFKVLLKGKVSEVYNIGSGNERRNIDVARMILRLLGKSDSLINYVADRPGHDFRYSLSFSKIKKELGWIPRVKFEEGIIQTVRWYEKNLNWLEAKVRFLRGYWKKTYK